MSKDPKPSKLRCFVGIKFSLQDEISNLREDLVNSDEDSEQPKLVPPKNMHITLKFLGSVLESELATIEAILKETATNHARMEIACKGLGLFKNSIWVGIEPNPAIDKLGAALNEAFTGMGIAAENKNFVPHVTIAKFKPSSKTRLLGLQEKYQEKEWGNLKAPQIHLYRSETLEHGPRYSIIDSYDLSTPD